LVLASRLRWAQYRLVVQKWDETIGVVAKKDLDSEQYNELEEVVLRSNALDQEILSMLQRWPPVFHLGMLPSCSCSTLRVDDHAKLVVQAHKEAADGQLKVFQAEMEHDWAQISSIRLGSVQLQDLLAWLALEHRRKQAELGEALVQRRMSMHHAVAEISAWSQLPGQVSLVLKGFPDVVGTRRMVMVLDFNTPHSRNKMHLQHMIPALANLAKVVGGERCVLMTISPNCPKEDSQSTPDQDEQDIAAAFSKAGFSKQLRWRQVVTLHPSVANKTSELDWFIDGRLLSLVDIADNAILQNSELAKRRRVMGEVQLPLTKDLVSITSLNQDEDINVLALQPDVPFKCAQRGPAVFTEQLLSLLTKVPLGERDETVLLDVLPYVGDRQLGLHAFMQSKHADNQGIFRGIIVKFVSKGSETAHSKGADFTLRRLTNKLTKEWLDRTLVLYDTQTTGLGPATAVVVSPSDTARFSALRSLQRLTFKFALQ
jgi:hypothetical protein